MCVCMRVREGWNGGGGGVGGKLKQDMLGIKQSAEKCHMICNTGLIYLASERICCMWFGGENVFLLCSRSGQTQHMETFSERPQVCGGKKKAPDILFLLPLFIAFFSSSQTDWISHICSPYVETS